MMHSTHPDQQNSARRPRRVSLWPRTSTSPSRRTIRLPKEGPFGWRSRGGEGTRGGTKVFPRVRD